MPDSLNSLFGRDDNLDYLTLSSHSENEGNRPKTDHDDNQGFLRLSSRPK